jgi:hypothetical protein
MRIQSSQTSREACVEIGICIYKLPKENKVGEYNFGKENFSPHCCLPSC